MGAYRAAVVTAAGQNIIAQALADVKAVEFTSAKTSSYLYPSGTNITGLTGLQDVEQSVIPFAAQVMNGNVVQVSVRFDNDEITQQYPINTIGLYAKVKDGEEVLFSVIQAIIPDEMPVHSDVSPSAFIYNIQHTVQNAAQITIVVNPAGTATVQDIYGLTYPEFEDSGEAEGITGFPGFLEKIKSKMNIFEFYRNFKAGMQYVLHTGQIVNNCVSDASNLPLAAAQGKALWDRQTQLNSNLAEMWQFSNENAISIPDGADMKSQTYLVPGAYKCDTDVRARTLKNCPSTSAFTLFVYKPLANHAAYLMQEFRNLHGYVYKRRYAGYDENIQQGTEWGGDSELVLSPGLGENRASITKSGYGIYFQVGAKNSYTQFVINDNYIAVEHFTDGKRDKSKVIWDGTS